MKIVEVEFELQVVNKELAFFNCNKKVSGVIHAAESGKPTVVLDGCYLLGNFHCTHCAIKAIGLLAAKITDCESAGFGSYRSYKLDYSEKVFQAIH